MSVIGNENKKKLLREPFGTANAKLKKSIFFKLLQEVGKDVCFQCGRKIEAINELSIEHKVPWMGTDNPVESFYDLDNIAFSHLVCNIRASSIKYKKEKAFKMGKLNKIVCEEGFSHCNVCKKNIPVDCFSKNKNTYNGLDEQCKECKSIRKRKYSKHV